MKKVAFICLANACRSQIAEAISKEIANDIYEVYSAGIRPLGRICLEVIQFLQSRGIDISDQYSKGLDEIPLDQMDYIISMGCCTAASICPVSYEGRKIDWNIPDPYGQSSYSIEEVYNIIEHKIKAFIKENFTTNPKNKI